MKVLFLYCSKMAKRSKNSANVKIKDKFKKAMFKLRRFKRQNQRLTVARASREFINDISQYLKKIQTRPHLVKNKKHRQTLKKHRGKLRRLVDPHLSTEKKRQILLMKGGIVPFLIPIICASIGAAGSVGAAATSAAILKS